MEETESTSGTSSLAKKISVRQEEADDSEEADDESELNQHSSSSSDSDASFTSSDSEPEENEDEKQRKVDVVVAQGMLLVQSMNVLSCSTTEFKSRSGRTIRLSSKFDDHIMAK